MKKYIQLPLFPLPNALAIRVGGSSVVPTGELPLMWKIVEGQQLLPGFYLRVNPEGQVELAWGRVSCKKS